MIHWALRQTDSNRFDMSKKNGMWKTGKIKAQFKVS